MLTRVEECMLRIMSNITLSGNIRKNWTTGHNNGIQKCHCFSWHLHVSPPEDKWCPLTETSPMAFSPPVICQSPQITQHSQEKVRHHLVIFMQRNKVLIEKKKIIIIIKHMWQRFFSFSKPLMSKFLLSKQHGLVLMLHRAMGEEKKRKCRKGGEGHDRFIKI